MSAERELLYRALAERWGVVVKTSDAPLLKQRLYAARRKLNDPDLAALSFATSPTNPDAEVWIVHNASQEQRPPQEGSDPTP